MVDMAQETPEQQLARLLMQGGDAQPPAGNNQVLADALIPPPRNPAMPADWAQNAVRGVGGKLADLIMAPRRAMDQGMTTEEAVPWAGDMALNMAGAGGLGAASGAAGVAGGKLVQPQGIRGYHVSPHDFAPEPGFPLGRFDMSKINTGQGSQSYGHGHYIAENPAVSGGPNSQYWQEFSRQFIDAPHPNAEGLATFMLAAHKGDRSAAINELMTEGVGSRGLSARFKSINPRDAVALLESDKPVGPRNYEVNINAKPEQFLDWEKPFVEQPPQVQDAVQRLLGEVKPRSSDAARGYDIYDQVVTRGLDTRPSIYRDDRLLWDEMAKKKPIASSMLNEAGIPGIKYLDQGSRPTATPTRTLQRSLEEAQSELKSAQASGDGTRAAMAKIKLTEIEGLIAGPEKSTSNYVLFDDKLIDILRKYGLGGAAPSAAALAEALSRQPADSAK